MRCIAIAATTLDGKIALDAGHFSDWTSPEDKTFMRTLLEKCDVVVVGHNTYKTAIEPLSKRNCIVLTSSVATTERKSDKLILWNPMTTTFEAVAGEYKTVAILGGAKTYSYFLQNNLLDELYLTIEPLVFGRGINLFEHSSSKPARFKLLSMEKLNDTGSVLLRYEVSH
jgi:dihydrofolate reductase